MLRWSKPVTRRSFTHLQHNPPHLSSSFRNIHCALIERIGSDSKQFGRQLDRTAELILGLSRFALDRDQRIRRLKEVACVGIRHGVGYSKSVWSRLSTLYKRNSLDLRFPGNSERRRLPFCRLLEVEVGSSARAQVGFWAATHSSNRSVFLARDMINKQVCCCRPTIHLSVGGIPVVMAFLSRYSRLRPNVFCIPLLHVLLSGSR